MNRHILFLLLLLASMALGAAASAQPATAAQKAGVKPENGFSTFHMHTRLGSFKVVSQGDTPAQGRFEMSFTGSAMISHLDGKLEVLGNLRKEYDKGGRKVYQGTGKIIVTGKWRSLQWFGRNMQAVWYGKGAIRLTGEFDNQLETGQYWYEDPNVKNYWQPGGSVTLGLPEFGDAGVKPVERGKEKGKGGG